ncbi:hypothetical protein FYJ85_09865 [Victivallaceae bacterium BBE-744-WT-12]|uniref:Uncharacterized protein n=1 Tax=Victivallis lenta TaxID=2606640 RepID=A0A844G159_9BACT|nr:hypothetical protein [Victivallis lenta]
MGCLPADRLHAEKRHGGTGDRLRRRLRRARIADSRRARRRAGGSGPADRAHAGLQQAGCDAAG